MHDGFEKFCVFRITLSLLSRAALRRHDQAEVKCCEWRACVVSWCLKSSCRILRLARKGKWWMTKEKRRAGVGGRRNACHVRDNAFAQIVQPGYAVPPGRIHTFQVSTYQNEAVPVPSEWVHDRKERGPVAYKRVSAVETVVRVHIVTCSRVQSFGIIFCFHLQGRLHSILIQYTTTVKSSDLVLLSS